MTVMGACCLATPGLLFVLIDGAAMVAYATRGVRWTSGRATA
jgi:hypothetical protein